MRCRSALTRIDAMRTGELAARERRATEEHLEDCPSCRASVDDVRELAAAVKSVGARPSRSCREALADSLASITGTDGTVWVAFTHTGLRMIHRGTVDELRTKYAKRYGRVLAEAKLPATLRRQVMAALRGKGVDDPRVDWGDQITGIVRDVLETLTRIPRGEVRTYAWVAREIGRPRAVRAVGTICARNVVPFVVPCHRVGPSTGGVGNYAFGSAMKRELLRREGVDVRALERRA